MSRSPNRINITAIIKEAGYFEHPTHGLDVLIPDRADEGNTLENKQRFYKNLLADQTRLKAVYEKRHRPRIVIIYRHKRFSLDEFRNNPAKSVEKSPVYCLNGDKMTATLDVNDIFNKLKTQLH